MDDELDFKDFSGRVRLFPLPGVLLFPHAVTPLHIFEPRYRRMIEDALADDGLIAMVQLTGDAPRPPIAEIGCLGRIIHHERLADGRFNILLLGRKRVRLIRERDDDFPYRTADVEVLNDLGAEVDESAARAELIERLTTTIGVESTLMELLHRAESLGALIDVTTQALAATPDWKQRMLNEPSVPARLAMLEARLLELRPPRRTFPPPFSVN